MLVALAQVDEHQNEMLVNRASHLVPDPEDVVCVCLAFPISPNVLPHLGPNPEQGAEQPDRPVATRVFIDERGQKIWVLVGNIPSNLRSQRHFRK